MMADRGRDQGHPPIEFPFFGLAEWIGPTWVEFYEGALNAPITTLWLGHRVPQGRAHLSVGTDNERMRGLDVGENLAFGALFTLSERMRPDRAAVRFPKGFNRAQLEYVRPSVRRTVAHGATGLVQRRRERDAVGLLALHMGLGRLRARCWTGRGQARRSGHRARHGPPGHRPRRPKVRLRPHAVAVRLRRQRGPHRPTTDPFHGLPAASAHTLWFHSGGREISQPHAPSLIMSAFITSGVMRPPLKLTCSK